MRRWYLCIRLFVSCIAHRSRFVWSLLNENRVVFHHLVPLDILKLMKNKANRYISDKATLKITKNSAKPFERYVLCDRSNTLTPIWPTLYTNIYAAMLRSSGASVTDARVVLLLIAAKDNIGLGQWVSRLGLMSQSTRNRSFRENRLIE